MNVLNLLSVSILIVSLCCNGLYSKSLASKKCSLKDSHCLVETIQEALENMKYGDSDVNTPSLEPVEIPSLIIGGHGSVNIEQKYTNVKIYGLTITNVTKAEYDKATKIFKFTTISPEVQFKADYDISGKILLLPIVGKGPAILTFSNLEIQNIIKMEEVEKKGEKYFKPIKYDIVLNTKKAHFDLKNLFDGNKQIAEPVLATLNDNWSTIFLDIKNGYEEGLEPVLMNYAKRVFAKKSIRELFD